MKELVLELKVLFGLGKWYKVFNSKESAIAAIPDKKSILVHLSNVEICLARHEEKISAFINLCPHHQMPLNKGTFNEKQEWICPYHRHCFNLENGKNMTMPQTNHLELFHIKSNQNGLFVYKSNKQQS
jgi:nitrite reductase/ring-hydroxylating ferredoxin subunit